MTQRRIQISRTRPRYGRAIRDYYEDLWERLPAELDPPSFERRLHFLLGEVRPGDRVLDVGCGTGDFTAAMARAGADAIGVDVAEAALRRARSRHPGVEFRLVPLDGPLPFEDGSFELVWASEVIEHVADTARWLSEVRRVLAPGGRLLVTTPSHGRLRVAVGGVERFSEPARRSPAPLHEALARLAARGVRVRRGAGARGRGAAAAQPDAAGAGGALSPDCETALSAAASCWASGAELRSSSCAVCNSRTATIAWFWARSNWPSCS